MSDWRLINTAPRDGTAILVGRERYQPQLVRWMISASKDAPEGWWFVGGYDGPRLRWQPTHWQDCPTGPGTEMGHILYSENDCQVFHSEGRQCPVCEGGLAVCKVCSEYEAGLDNPCKPRYHLNPKKRGSEMSESEYDWVYDSGPFCRHWSDPSDCEIECDRCGDRCGRHEMTEGETYCNNCECPKWEEPE